MLTAPVPDADWAGGRKRSGQLATLGHPCYSFFYIFVTTEEM